jgi:hypothetical protein
MTAPRTPCQGCARNSPNAFLCPTCQHELHDHLTNLIERTATNSITGEQRPTMGFIEALQDKTWGQTREGRSERRSNERGSPMPVHLGASHLLDNIKDMLHRWAQHITIHTGDC